MIPCLKVKELQYRTALIELNNVRWDKFHSLSHFFEVRMNIEEIQNEIKTLENDATTFSNVSKLASLYIVNERLQNGAQTIVDGIQRELNDILPAYKKYVEIKREFQLKNADKTALIDSIQLVCKELQEFISTLYNNTECEECRNLISKTLKSLDF